MNEMQKLLQSKSSATIAVGGTQRQRKWKAKAAIRSLLLPSIIVLCIILYINGFKNSGFLRETEGYGTIFNNNVQSIAKSNTSSPLLSHFHQVPYFSNRFRTPWDVPARLRFLSLRESRNRILYSSLREMASDGIGHGFATLNADIGVALRLGLTYTHRVARHSSLTNDDSDAIEKFFGWADHEIPRSVIRDSFCKIDYDGNPASCQICPSAKQNTSYPWLKFTSVVSLPEHLTYLRAKCPPGNPEETEVICNAPIREFIREHNEPNTIFQMPPSLCDESPVDSYIDSASRSVLFHKYWDIHGDVSTSGDAAAPGLKMIHGAGRLPRYSVSAQRPSLDFAERELIIAVHARRGDFFQVQRMMISFETFASVIWHVMRIVHSYGGVFSRMPVSINFYSEGTAREGEEYVGHDLKYMTTELVDSDGTVRSAEWLTQLIQNSSAVDEEETENQRARKEKEEKLFPNGVKVKLHVSKDTIQTLHEMIAADVFLGSDSGMGKYIVSTLSRGALQLLPTTYNCVEHDDCMKTFESDSGNLWDKKHVEKTWGQFARANQGSAIRAVCSHKLFSK